MIQGRGRAWGALFLTILLGAAVSGEQVYRGRTDLVVLNITASDAAGRLLPGLDLKDFQIFEDGVLQTVTNFTRDPQPIALVILLDSSVSMESKLKTAQEAAIGFARRLTSKDVAEVIEFDTYTKVQQKFTADADLLEKAIRRTEADGSTALYNALYVAFNEFKKEQVLALEDVRRHAVVVLSDGEDTSSVVSFDLVLDEAKRSEVMTYGIGIRPKETGPGPTRAWNQAEFVLRSISYETGGKSFSVGDSKDLPAIYDQIARELANQYTLGYMSTNLKRDGAWRKVTVQMVPAEARARTKTGYFAPSTPR